MVIGHFLQWNFILLYLFLSFSTGLHAQDKVSTYVVVGAFEFEENANDWVKFTRSKSFDAVSRRNFNRNLFYVYVLQTDSWDEALVKLREVWKTSYFPDAWIYTGNFGQEYIPLVDRKEEKAEPAGTNVNGQTEAPPLLEASASFGNIAIVEDKPVKTASEIREDVIIKKHSLPDTKVDDRVINLADFNIFFNLYNSQNLQDVEGEVQVIDTQRNKLLQAVKGGEYASLMDPSNGTGKLSLIVETFGYRKAQYDINFDQPFADTSSVKADMRGDVLVYNFPLVRYHKGDIVTMYNVYFFKDAAIMRPESRYEVQSLLAMLEENSNYKIKIHGHTNGNNMGKIIYAGDDQDFFALTDDDKEGFGSAKKLSKERSLIIRDFLISKGVAAERMEVKAWGGKRMIYDKMSNLASKNVRVEIEILAD